MQKIKNNKSIILASCLMLLFVFLIIMVKKYDYLTIDLNVYNFLNRVIDLSYLFYIKVITNFGGPYVLIFLAISLFLVLKNKKVGLFIILNLIMVTILNIILKNLICRPRPSVRHLVEEDGYSCPSGHAMASFAFYGFLIYLIYRYVENKKLKVTLISILSLLICLIGLSRVYLGVHYFSDIIAGFIITFCYLIVFIKIIKRKIS